MITSTTLSTTLPAAAGVVSNEDFTVKVDFNAKERFELLPAKIARLNNPKVIFWYIGTDGLKQEGVSFYKKRFSKLFAALSSQEYRCYLYDLTPWGAFKNPSSKLDSPPNPIVAQINELGQERIKAISAVDFFKWMKNENRENVVSLFSGIFNTEKVYSPSVKFENSKISLGDIFNRSCLMLAYQYNRDTAKSYSAIQYVEGIYLVDQIVKEQIESKGEGDIDIVFALPNDENKYYQNEARIFSNDVKAFLKENRGEKLRGKTICLTFFSFIFGAEGNRPYNAGAAVVAQVTKEDLGLS